MRTVTITKELYTFAELSDRAKERARDWYRQCNDSDTYWCEYTTDTLAPNAATFLGIAIDKPRHARTGLAIYWSGFSSQGDGACFVGSWRASAVDVAGLVKEFPTDKELHRIGEALAQIAKDYPDASFYTENYRGNNMRVSCDMGDADTLPDGSDDPDRLGDWRDAFPEDDLKEAAQDFATWIYRALEREYDYQNSDECVDESIEANGYEFDENGGIAK